jgi:hypothetical protein
VYPDLVLASTERGRKLQALIEVETGESVNHLEALAQWTHFSRLRVPFHLYVPSGMVDVARRLCEDNNVHVSEIWSYHTVGDDVRFTLVDRSREAPSASPRGAARPQAAKAPAAKPPAAKTVAARAEKTPKKLVRPAAKPARPARAARSTKPKPKAARKRR